MLETMGCILSRGGLVGFGVGMTLEVDIHRLREARIEVERWGKILWYVA